MYRGSCGFPQGLPVLLGENMKKQVYNPFLPLTEYIPDGEPHVFGDRVYLYGSHDKAKSNRFCVQDYTVWSAPVDDLSDWICHGVTYKKSQDPRSQDDRPKEKYPDFYAPDCVQGNDGRYYLYYCAMGPHVHPFGPISVAVSDKPAGPFEYLGDIRNPDGTPLLKFLTNDPAVINDKGKIYLYYGWGLGFDFRSKALGWYFRWVESIIFKRSVKEIKETKPSIMNCVCIEMENDMLTVKKEPVSVLDSKDTADKKSEFYKHPFFEAASIRRFKDLYYLVYSSGVHNELAYATSEYPDHGFIFRGVIVSNSDLGINGNKKKKNAAGTIHGGIECIKGQYYVFYHRCTHNTDYSRQACAEPIEIEPDGTIQQVEITSCGLNGLPLAGVGTYPAAICCHLYGNVVPKLGNKHCTEHRRVLEQDGQVFIHDIDNSTVIGYKYYDYSGETEVTLKYRGYAKGVLDIKTEEDGGTLASLVIEPVETWNEISTKVPFPKGKSALYLVYNGKGKFDFLNFTLS